MERLHRQLADRGLAVVAVSVDKPDLEATIREYVTDLDLTFEVLYDRTGLFSSVYRYTGVPETYIIDREGVVRKKWIGPEEWDSPANIRFLETLLGGVREWPGGELNDARPATPTG